MRGPIVLAALLAIGACSKPAERPADSAAGTSRAGRSADSAAAADTTPAVARPIFEIALWPGEGIPVVEAAADTLVLRDTPSASAKVVAVARVKRGARVEYDDTRYQTLHAAPVHVLRPDTIRGRWVGARTSLSRAEYQSRALRDTSIAVSDATTIELLQQRAEGTCFLRIGGGVVEADPCPSTRATHFHVAGRPQTAWWIHVARPSAAGWLSLEDSTARVATRRF